MTHPLDDDAITTEHTAKMSMARRCAGVLPGRQVCSADEQRETEVHQNEGRAGLWLAFTPQAGLAAHGCCC